MKKIFGIALVLAVITTLCFGGVAYAGEGDDPPRVEVTFNGENPDVSVGMHAENTFSSLPNTTDAWFELQGTGPSSGYVTTSLNSGIDASFSTSGSEVHAGAEKWQPYEGWRRATASFDLVASSSFVGGVTVSAADTDPWVSVSGGYTGSGGDFSSSFRAHTWAQGNQWGASEYLSSHSIDAIGVNDNPIIIDPDTSAVSGGSLTVSGDASAVAEGIRGACAVLGAGQSFDGEAESATIDAIRAQWYYGWRTGWDTPSSTTQFANFTGTVTGDSVATFVGSTEGKCDDSVDNTWWKRDHHGLGFDVDVGSSVDGRLETMYGYTSLVALDGDDNGIGTQITFDEGWAIIEAFNADHIVGETATWDGYPGYTDPMP